MDNNGVQSVERTFSIIEALSRAAKGSFLGELSQAVGLSKSTVHRLLSCLISMGYVSKDNENGKYCLTLKMFEVGGRVVENLDVLSAARPYLEKLSAATGEAVHLVVRDGNDIVYIMKEDSGSSSVRMSSRVGLRSPIYCTAVGKAILAELTDAEIDGIWNSSNIVKRTNKTITELNELKMQLDAVRAKGYAVDDEENEPGVRCVGASLQDYSGRVVGAFSVSAPASRISDQRLLSISELVLDTKRQICSKLGRH